MNLYYRKLILDLLLCQRCKDSRCTWKASGYMKASLTVIVIADKYNDSHKLLKESGCGFSSNHEKENVDQMLNDLDKSDLKLLEIRYSCL